MKENEYIPPLYLDEKIQTPYMKAVKAIIPYMEPSAGKKAALVVKMMEMKNIITLFEEEVAIQADDASRSKNILQAISPFFGEEMQKMAELIERAEEMSKMAQIMMAFSADDDNSE